MADKKPASSPVSAAPTVSVSEQTLEATPTRALIFLRGVGTSDPIRLSLASLGYDAAEHARGWSLLHAVSGFTAPSTAAADDAPDAQVANAISAIDAADERIHRIVDASLRHRFPALRDELLADLKPARGAESVLYVRTLLSRLSKLSGPDGKAALEVLSRRSLTPAYRAELAALVKTAERYTAPTAPAADDGSYQSGLRALRAWFEEWAELARTELSRKDYLLRLGLARRKRTTPAATPSDPAPVK
jgi:hypothetical protein